MGAVTVIAWEAGHHDGVLGALGMHAVSAALCPLSRTQQNVFEPLGFANTVLVLTGA